MTTPIPETSTSVRNSESPPPVVPPPELVRLRVELPGEDYRALKHLALETGLGANELAVEAIRMLRRWYIAQGVGR